MVKRILISAIIAFFLDVTLFAVLTLLPSEASSRVFITVGMPVGILFALLIPDKLVYKIAPEGGADAVVIIFSVSAFITWFFILFILVYFVRDRLRARNTTNEDVRPSQ
jgi:hypothetical protein